MELSTFTTFAHYRRAQQKTNKGKGPERVWAPERELVAIADWCESMGVGPIRNGMCHGARSGYEIDKLESLFPDSDFVGTDLLNFEHEKVIEWDFHEQKPGWIDAFDLIYTNSWDHTYDPIKSLQCWHDQLRSPHGILAIEWSSSHTETRNGDCFGAALHEYIQIIERVAVIADIMYLGGSLCTILVTAEKYDWGKTKDGITQNGAGPGRRKKRRLSAQDLIPEPNARKIKGKE